MSPPAKGKGPMGPPSNRKGNLGIGSEVSASTEDEEKTNAYDTNFEKMLADRGITQPDPDHEPVNKNEWLVGLAQERSSNSVETISDDYFREFQRVVKQAHVETKVMKFIYPYLRGDARVDNAHIGQQNRVCANWEKLTDEKLVIPQPDLFDGINELSYPQLRSELPKSIVPADNNSPSLPNLFAEFKSPKGTSGCAERQACYDGALGARGIHRARNYGMEPGEEMYDNKAYTISFTYVGGTLAAFLHFISKRRDPADDLQYKMHLLDGWHLRGNMDQLKKGITAFRNARDMARRIREEVARIASAKVKQIMPTSEWIQIANSARAFNETANVDSGDENASAFNSQASDLTTSE